MEKQLDETEKVYLLENLKTAGTLCGVNFSAYVSEKYRRGTAECSFDELKEIIALASRLFFRLQAEIDNAHSSFLWRVSMALQMNYPLRLSFYTKVCDYVNRTLKTPDEQPQFETNFTQGLISYPLLGWSYRNAACFYAQTVKNYVLSDDDGTPEKTAALQKRYYAALERLHGFLIEMRYSFDTPFWQAFENTLVEKYPLVQNLSALEELVASLSEEQAPETMDSLLLPAQAYHLISSYLGHSKKR